MLLAEELVQHFFRSILDFPILLAQHFVDFARPEVLQPNWVYFILFQTR